MKLNITIIILTILTSCVSNQETININMQTNRNEIELGEVILITGSVDNIKHYRIDYYNDNGDFVDYINIPENDFLIKYIPRKSGLMYLYEKTSDLNVIGPIRISVIVEEEEEKEDNDLVIEAPTKTNNQENNYFKEETKVNNIIEKYYIDNTYERNPYYFDLNDYYVMRANLSELERIEMEKQILYKEKLDFNNYKNIELARLDSLERAYRNEYERLYEKLNADRIEFELYKNENETFLKNIDQLKADMALRQEQLDEKYNTLNKMEGELLDREEWVKRKEDYLARVLHRRLSLGLSIFPGYNYNTTNQLNSINFGGAATLDYHFGIEKDTKFEIESNRVGLFYYANSFYNLDSNLLTQEINHYQGAYLEFDSRFRISIGKDLFNLNPNNLYENIGMISFNMNNYPAPISLFVGLYFNNDMSSKMVFSGVSFGFDLRFFRM